MPNVLDTDRFFKAADDAVAGDTSSSSTATDDETSDARLRDPTSTHENLQHNQSDRTHAHHHNTDVTRGDNDDDDDDEGAPMPSFLGSESALELRCKVPPCFAVSRDVGLRWFEAARMGDMRTVKQLLQARTAMADGAVQTERARLLSSRANAPHPKRSPSVPTDNNAKSGEESEKRKNEIDRLVGETKAHVIRQLLHYNGQGTTYGFIGGTVLHWACANGDLAMATLLLDAGSSANVQNRGGSTPLHAACAHGEPALVALLLARGGDVTIEDCCADTPQDVIPRDPVARQEITPLLKAQAAATELIEGARRILAAQSQSGRARNSSEEDPNDAEFFTTCDDATRTAIEAAWRPGLMKTVILATGQVEDAGSMPLERSDLVALTRTALAAFQRNRALAADADTHAQRLHQKARRHAEKMEAAIAARLDETSSSDDDEDHDARTPPVHLDADQAARQTPLSGESGDGGETAVEAKRARRREKRLFAEEHAAKQAKDKGNELFQRGDYKAAVQRYTMAIGIIGNDATFYSNRAAAYMKLNLPQRALEDGRKAAALKPEWAKAHHRIGAAAFALGRFEESARAFSYGLGLAPDDATLKEGYAQAFMMAQQDSQSSSVPHPQRHVDAHADDGDDDEYEYESEAGERGEGDQCGEKNGGNEADFDGSYDDDKDGFGHEAMVQDTEIRDFIAAEREKLRQMTIRAEAVAERAGMASDDDSDGPLDDHRRHLRGRTQPQHTTHRSTAAHHNEQSDHRPHQSSSNPTVGGRNGPPADGNESDEDDDDEPIDDELYARAMQFAQKRLGALAGRLQQEEDVQSSDGDGEGRGGPGHASAGRSRGAVDSGFGRRAGPAVADIPIVQRKPWFDCAVCENKTRDSAVTTCCGKQLCGTCLKRAATCPFGC